MLFLNLVGKLVLVDKWKWEVVNLGHDARRTMPADMLVPN